MPHVVLSRSVRSRIMKSGYGVYPPARTDPKGSLGLSVLDLGLVAPGPFVGELAPPWYGRLEGLLCT